MKSSRQITGRFLPQCEGRPVLSSLSLDDPWKNHYEEPL
jgi:hypothetical protein